MKKLTKGNVLDAAKRTGKGFATVGKSLASAANKYDAWQAKNAKKYGGGGYTGFDFSGGFTGSDSLFGSERSERPHHKHHHHKQKVKIVYVHSRPRRHKHRRYYYD